MKRSNRLLLALLMAGMMIVGTTACDSEQNAEMRIFTDEPIVSVPLATDALPESTANITSTVVALPVTETSEPTTAPVTTQAPITTTAPATTKVPIATMAPTTTRLPTTTKAPETTTAPTTTKAPETTTAPTTTKTPETTTAPTTTKTPATTAAPQEYDFVLNIESKKFHTPDCGSGKKISAENREEFCGTWEELIALGYSPCGNCDPAPDFTAAPTTTKTPTTTDAPQEYDFVLNTESKRFHTPDCGSGKRISAENRQEFCGTREELIAEGYSPCGNCKP